MSITSTLLDIARYCTSAPGGLQDLGLIHPDDVDTITPLTFKPGKRMYLFQQDRFSGRLRTKQVRNSAQGDYREYSLTANVKGIRLDMDLLIQRLTNRNVHVLVSYFGGAQRLLLNVRITSDHDSGDRIGSKNGYSIEGFTQALDGVGASKLLDAALVLPTISTGGSDPDPGAGMDGTVVTLTTSDSTYSYTIPAGKLLTAIYLKSTAAQTPSIGLGPGTNEIMDAVPLASGQYGLAGNNSLYAATPTTIYFSGLTGTNTLKIWLLG